MSAVHLPPRPSNAEIEHNLHLTRLALQARYRELGIEDPNSTTPTPSSTTPKLLQYTHHNAPSPSPSPSPSSHVLEIAEQHNDPLRPRKRASHKGASAPHAALPARASSPPGRSERSPPRALTPAERAEWNIPSCVSNYVNPLGHVIPLEVRALQNPAEDFIQPGERHTKLRAHASRIEAKTRNEMERRAGEERRLAEAVAAREEAELRALAERDAQRYEKELRAARGRESEDERRDRREREKVLGEQRREVHRQQLRMEGIRRRTGVDVEFQRDLTEILALGDGENRELPASHEALYDQRLAEVAREETKGDGLYTRPLFSSSASRDRFSRKNIEKEMEFLSNMDASFTD